MSSLIDSLVGSSVPVIAGAHTAVIIDPDHLALYYSLY